MDLTEALPDKSVNYVTMGEVRDYVDDTNELRGYRRAAIVAPSLVNYGLVQMFKRISEDSPLKVEAFKDHKAALDWLASSEKKVS